MTPCLPASEVDNEPDARFTLANERTFLAGIRTALALLAGGVAIEMLGPGLDPQFRLAASALLLVAGIFMPVAAWLEWRAVQCAMRRGGPLPSPASAAVLTVVTCAVGVTVMLALILG